MDGGWEGEVEEERESESPWYFEGGGEGGELGRIGESDAYCPSPTSLLCHPAPSP